MILGRCISPRDVSSDISYVRLHDEDPFLPCVNILYDGFHGEDALCPSW